jgi:phage terminase small subunit
MKPQANKERKLTPKEERFCYEYLACGLNATKAALKAGYSPKTADVIGNQNLGKLKVQTRIQHMKDNLAETAGITALMIVKEHAKIAFANAADTRDGWMSLKDFNALPADVRATIQEVQTKETRRCIPEGDDVIDTWVKIKTYDKQKSLDALSNIFGINAPTKHDFQGNLFLELMKTATSGPE